MDCERHPEQKAIGRCLECGKGICSQCVSETDQVLVCPGCFQKEIDRLAAALGAAHGKAPGQKKEKPPGGKKPKKGELPAAPVPAPPPVVPAAVEAPPVVPAVPPPGEALTGKPGGKAKKEKLPRAKREKPPKEKKRKKSEVPVAPEVTPPTFVTAGGETPPPSYEPAPPEVYPVEAEAAPLPVPPTFEGPVEPEYPPPPVYEEVPPAPEAPVYEPMPPQPGYEQPPDYEPPVQEPAIEGGYPEGFGEGVGMMERVRPEQVTAEEYLPTPEHQEILGEPGVEGVAPWGDTGEAAPVEQISEVTVASGEEVEIPGEEPPVEEAPAPESFEEPAPPPPPPFEGLPQVEKVEPAVEEEIVDVTGEEEYGVKVDDTEAPETPPGRQVETQEELHSFFFEDEIDKKGKDQKGDKGSFWE